MSDDAWRSRRLRKRRLRHLRYAALTAVALIAVVAVVWVALLVDTSSPEEALPPLPAPMADAVTTPPPAIGPTTAPPTPDASTPLVRLAVLGDAGTRESMQRRVAAQIAAADRQGRPFDALLVTGDLVYEEGDSDLTEESVVHPYSTTFTVPEIIPSLGNHDVESDEGDEIMERLGRPGAVYTQDVGPVRVIVLDSNHVSSAQTAWLGRILDQPRPAGTWVIAVMHHPAFSSGEHGSEDSVRRSWAPLFARHGANLVLAGHDHDYERTKPQNGVTYIVTGGGGAELRDVGRSSFTAASAEKHHFVDLNVFADRIEGRAVDANGTAFDTFRIPLGSAN